MKLSAIIPTLNEQKNISDAIHSVSFADEIIVIDSFSNDKTIEIAEKSGATIIQRKFDNFSNQKNYAIKKASGKWILLLDADERISEELKNEIQNIICTDRDSDAYWIFRKNFFMGREVRFSGWKNDKVIRLIRNGRCLYNNKPVHEEIETNGKTGFLKNKLLHNTYKSTSDYKRKLQLYAFLQAKELKNRGKRVTFFHLYFKPAFRFFRHFVLMQGFRDGKTGFLIAKLQAYGVFLRYLKLKEISD